MNQADSSTNKYQVIGVTPQGKDVWASYNNPTEASNHAQQLTQQIEGISFHVKDLNPPTDEEVQEYFGHLNFGGA